MRRANSHATAQPAEIPRHVRITETSVMIKRDIAEAAAIPTAIPPRVPICIYSPRRLLGPTNARTTAVTRIRTATSATREIRGTPSLLTRTSIRQCSGGHYAARFGGGANTSGGQSRVPLKLPLDHDDDRCGQRPCQGC